MEEDGSGVLSTAKGYLATKEIKGRKGRGWREGGREGERGVTGKKERGKGKRSSNWMSAFFCRKSVITTAIF